MGALEGHIGWHRGCLCGCSLEGMQRLAGGCVDVLEGVLGLGVMLLSGCVQRLFGGVCGFSGGSQRLA